MLAETEVVPYLLRRKLLPARAVVEGDLSVIDASRRNHNFGVIRSRGASYFLKQGTDPEHNASIANEANVYQRFYSDQKNIAFTRYLPRYFGHDPDDHILFIEFLTGVEDLQQYHSRCGRFPTRIAASIGDALRLLHRESSIIGKGNEPLLECPAPWVFSIHHPDIEILLSMSEASIQVIKIIQLYPEFSGLLDELHRGWKSETVIHSDFKWNNCLVSRSMRNTTIHIVDWELAGLGDPAWDLGSVISAYLSFWLLFVPLATDAQPAESLQLARYPLEKFHPAFRAFWQSYLRGTKISQAGAEHMLCRAVKYGAARLAQSAYEQMQVSPQLVGNAVCSLQLSLNILKRPEDAIRDLLGSPLV